MQNEVEKMVGSDRYYDLGRPDRSRKRNVTVHDIDGKRLGTYPVQPGDEGYQIVWRGSNFPVRKGEEGPEKGKFYLTNAGDAQRLGRRQESQPFNASSRKC